VSLQQTASAHRGQLGRIAGMRFSHYGHKRLETQAHRRRVAYMVVRAQLVPRHRLAAMCSWTNRLMRSARA
jgi:hypothetical protein